MRTRVMTVQVDYLTDYKQKPGYVVMITRARIYEA